MKKLIRSQESIQSTAYVRSPYDMARSASNDLQLLFDRVGRNTLSNYFDVDTLEDAMSTMSHGMNSFKCKFDTGIV